MEDENVTDDKPPFEIEYLEPNGQTGFVTVPHDATLEDVLSSWGDINGADCDKFQLSHPKIDTRNKNRKLEDFDPGRLTSQPFKIQPAGEQTETQQAHSLFDNIAQTVGNPAQISADQTQNEEDGECFGDEDSQPVYFDLKKYAQEKGFSVIKLTKLKNQIQRFDGDLAKFLQKGLDKEFGEQVVREIWPNFRCAQTMVVQKKEEKYEKLKPELAENIEDAIEILMVDFPDNPREYEDENQILKQLRDAEDDAENLPTLRQIKGYVQNERELDGPILEEVRTQMSNLRSLEDISKLCGRSVPYLQEKFGVEFCTFHQQDEVLDALRGLKEEYKGEAADFFRKMIREDDTEFRYLIQKYQRTHPQNSLEQYFNRFEQTKSVLKVKEIESDLQLMRVLGNISMESTGATAQRFDLDQIVIEQIASIDFEVPYDNLKTKEHFDRQLEARQNFDLKRVLTIREYRTVGLVNQDQKIKDFKSGENMRKNYQELFQEALPLCFFLIQCNQPLKPLVDLLAGSSTWKDVNMKDLFIQIYEQSQPELRSNLIEQHSYSNPVTLVYNVDRRIRISHELINFIRPQMAVVSFGLGKCNHYSFGKSKLLDTAFLSNFGGLQDRNSKFQFGSVDIQLCHNIFGDFKSQEEMDQTQWAVLDCSQGTDWNVIEAFVRQVKIALVHVIRVDIDSYFDQFIAKLNRLSSVGALQVHVLLRDEPNRDTKEDPIFEKIKESVTLENSTIISLHKIPNLSEDHEQSQQLRLTKIANKIIRTPRNEDMLLNKRSLMKVVETLDPDLAEEVDNDTKVVESVRDIIVRNISEQNLTKESNNVKSFQYLKYQPRFQQLVDLYSKSEYLKMHNESDAREFEIIAGQIKDLKDEIEKVIIGDGSLLKVYLELLNDPKSLLLVQQMNRMLANIRYEPEFIKRDLQEQQLMTLSQMYRELYLFIRYKNLIETQDAIGHDEAQLLSQASMGISKQIAKGEAFELIDGDTLEIFEKELEHVVEKTKFDHTENGMERQFSVISVIGRQSSGKSTLLNNSCGCKFAASAARCTKGVNIALRKINDELKIPGQENHEQIIIDTEGLQSQERNADKTCKFNRHFDRAMVTFCLSVSHIVIINIKGDIDPDTKELIGICGWALGKLQLPRDQKPKIYIVLNQQADPNQETHKAVLQTCIDQLEDQFKLEADFGDNKLSDLIDLQKKNLFILPNAFDPVILNSTSSQLFDFNVNRQIPTPQFAQKCNDLGQILLKDIRDDKNVRLKTFKQFMSTAGKVWRDIIDFPQLTTYKCMNELYANQHLAKFVEELKKEIQQEEEKENERLPRNLRNNYASLAEIAIQNITDEDPMTFDENFKHNNKVKIKQRYEIMQNFNRQKFENFVNANSDLLDSYQEIQDRNQRLLQNYESQRYLQFLKKIEQEEVAKETKINMNRKNVDLNTQLQQEFEVFKELIGENKEKEFNDYFDKIYDLAQQEDHFQDLQQQMIKDSVDFQDFIRANFGQDGPVICEYFNKFVNNMLTETLVDDQFSAEDQILLVIKELHHILVTNLQSDKFKRFGCKLNLDFEKYQDDGSLNGTPPRASFKNIIIGTSPAGRASVRQKSDHIKIQFFDSKVDEKSPGSMKDARSKKSTKAIYVTYKQLMDVEYQDEKFHEEMQMLKEKQMTQFGPVPTMSDSDTVHNLPKSKVFNRMISNDLRALAEKCCFPYSHKQHREFSNYPEHRQAVLLPTELMYVNEENKKKTIKSINRTTEEKGAMSVWWTFVTTIDRIINECILAPDMKYDDVLDAKNIQKTILRITNCINVVNFELAYLYSCLSLQAQKYIMIYALMPMFLVFHRSNQDRRNYAKVQAIEFKIEKRSKWLERVQTQVKFSQGELTVEESCRQDINKAQDRCNALYSEIKKRANTVAKNRIKIDLDSIQASQLNNYEMMQTLYERIEIQLAAGAPEAKSTKDERVRFVIDRNSLLDEMVDQIWSQREQDLFTKYQGEFNCCKDAYLEKVRQIIDALVQSFENHAKVNHKVSTQSQMDELFHVQTQFEMSSSATIDNRVKLPMAYLAWICGDNQKSFYYSDEKIAIGMATESVDFINFESMQIKIKDKNIFPNLSEDVRPAQIENILGHDRQAIIGILKASGVIQEDVEIYNIYSYLKKLQANLQQEINYSFEMFKQEIAEDISKIKLNCYGCEEKCPSCHKQCEHKRGHQLEDGSNHSCYRYGHQYLTMGGNVWIANSMYAVLQSCNSVLFTDETKMIHAGSDQTWKDFKLHNKDWDWPSFQLQQKIKKYYQHEFLERLWNKAGEQILKHYNKKLQKPIKFRKRTQEDNEKIIGKSTYQVCFVIDGTKSMQTDIEKARECVKNLKNNSEFKIQIKIIIYFDHDSEGEVLKYFPNSYDFTEDLDKAIKFLENDVEVKFSWDGPEAALDGLDFAASKCKWDPDWQKMLIHIYDAPPHGDFHPDENKFVDPNRHSYLSYKTHCCCCSNTKDRKDANENKEAAKKITCQANGDWSAFISHMNSDKIEYYGLCTKEDDYKDKDILAFEAYIKSRLASCKVQHQQCGKEKLGQNLIKLFVDRRNSLV